MKIMENINLSSNSESSVIKRFKVHFRVLTNSLIPETEMLDVANSFYGRYNISIDLISSISLVNTCPPEYKNRQIREDCTFGITLTSDESELYAYGRDAPPLQPCIYFINSTTPAAWGCVYRDPSKGSIIITKSANKWVFAHEVGHYLGLTYHSNDPNHLMNLDTRFTGQPYLNNNEISIIQTSEFLTV